MMSKMMRATALTTAFVALAMPAIGAEWIAEVVEDEGGPRMMASVAGTGGGDVPPELFMFCGADGISLRYTFGSGVPEGVQMPNDKPLPFTFEFGNGSASLDMQYEEYDGAFAAYFPKDHEIMDLFRTAATVIIDDPTKLYQVQSFPLTGSSDAIDKLLRACE